MTHAILAADVVVDHKVTWESQDEISPEQCDPWMYGKGTVDVRAHSLKRQQLRLETAYGSTFLSAKRPGTFTGSIVRKGQWLLNPSQYATQECGGCLDGEDCPSLKAPRDLAMGCGERELRNLHLSLGQGGTIPSLAQGVRVGMTVRRDEYLPGCPPALEDGPGVELQHPWPEWEKIPKRDLARITRLKVGDSVTSEVRTQRATWALTGRPPGKADTCSKMPSLKGGGTGECAVTEYRVVLTRIG